MPHQQTVGVTFRRLASAGITVTTASRAPAVLDALTASGFRLGLEDAPERYSLAEHDPIFQSRAAAQLAAALRDMGVPITSRPTPLPGLEGAAVAVSPSSAARVAAARTATTAPGSAGADQPRPAVPVPPPSAPAARR
ncbi:MULTISPECIES: hypothetical protein [unclassified Kitasatospora]|uniref:hypothetical protein n=1 Tax=unclassified Kitasatospora TaxID=2633591 RepID=UPI00053B2055|nr:MULTISPECIES: hypothetical protein [unclassified Kitasatospora]